MTRDEFEIQMGRVYGTFGEKVYSTERVKLIWGICSRLDVNIFTRIVSNFLATSRYAPLPSDFAEAAAKYREAQPEVKINADGCKYCADTGLAFVGHVANNYTSSARCVCDKGREHYSARQGLPQFNQDFQAKGYRLKVRFPQKKGHWVPRDGMSALELLECMKVEMDLNRAISRESRADEQKRKAKEILEEREA